MARPSEYCEEMAARICTEIASGRYMTQFASREGFPCRETIYRWAQEHPPFAERLSRAREMQADVLAEQTIEISDDSSGDDGNDSVQRSRLQCDTRKWFASKTAPQKYGDFQKQDLNIKGKVELGVSELLNLIDGQTRGLPEK